MERVASAKELRQFGFVVGGVFLFIGLWPSMLRGDVPHLWALVIGGLLACFGAALPLSLASIYRKWMALGHCLGWINTRIILGLIFFGLVTPIGIVMRLFGKDPLCLRYQREAETYRVIRTERERTHMRNQF